NCADLGNASATMVPGSFSVDEDSGYMEWTTNISVPLRWSDATCVTAYGEAGETAARLGRYGVTFNLKYSLARAPPPDQVTYKPLEIPEKDPIRRKYGPIELYTIARDEDSQQLASRQLVIRFDPTKPIVWYFEEGFPDKYKQVLLGPGGVKERTNQLFKD